MGKKLNILFLCTGNSCRSQMAEGLCKHYLSDTIEAYSAGIETHGLNPSALRVMAEIGIDISPHYSKTADELGNIDFDYVITVCDHAYETCPVFASHTQIIHHTFDDPPRLAKQAASEQQAMDHYRRVRDDIRNYILTLPQRLAKETPAAAAD